MISTLNVRSQTHNSCEDSLFVKESDLYIWGGIFDGCSTGKNSHWASQTFSYIFSKHVNPIQNSNLMLVRKDLITMMETLNINYMNLLSTCMLFFYDKFSKALDVRVFGDGCYYVDDVEYEIEQNNIPDYMAYHLDSQQSFKEFLDMYPAATYYNVSNFRICSDGIKSISIDQFHTSTKDPIATLFQRPTSPNFLQRMWNILHRERFIISDDLSIISYHE